MHYIYICCLAEESLGHVLGTLAQRKLAGHGFDASSLCILEFSPILRLRIYRELKRAQQDILQSTSAKAHKVIHTEAMIELFPGSLDTGGALAVTFDNPSNGLASAFLKEISMERLHVVWSGGYRDLLLSDLSNTTVRALFRQIKTRTAYKDGVYTLEWEVLRHPVIN